MDAIFEYSLIRVIPDSRRGEWVNVGVCVYLAGQLDIRIHPNFSKLRALAPGIDVSFLEALPQLWQSFSQKLSTAADKQQLLANMPLAHASGLGMFVAQPADYDRQVDAIVDDLVAPPSSPLRKMPEARLVTQLKAQFRNSRLYSENVEDIARHKVVAHYPIDAKAQLYADFALRNGVLRLTETIDFRVKPDAMRNKLGQAAIKAVTLDRAKALHQDCIPSVVYAVGPDRHSEIQAHLNLLSGYAERLYDAGNVEDMAAYMHMVNKAAYVQ